MPDIERPNFGPEMDQLARQIKQNNCIPIIGNQLALDMLFGRGVVAPAWAEEIKYPLVERDNLARIAQFQSVEGDTLTAKGDYLKFLNSMYLKAIPRSGPGAPSGVDWNLVSEQVKKGATFTKLVIDHLSHPTFVRPSGPGWYGNPFNILAAIKNFTIYITTGHHLFLERALSNVGRPAKTETYCWSQKVEIPPEWAVDPSIIPSAENPLVYHLFGLEERDATLVLTEDDHLDFLLEAFPGFMDTQRTPTPVRNAITKQVLLLIGYEIDGWDLRALLKGLVSRIQRSPISVAIQIDPQNNDRGRVLEPEIYRRYLSRSFDQVNFKVIWASPDEFMTGLWERLN